jgi:hypothetical protein
MAHSPLKPLHPLIYTPVAQSGVIVLYADRRDNRDDFKRSPWFITSLLTGITRTDQHTSMRRNPESTGPILPRPTGSHNSALRHFRIYTLRLLIDGCPCVIVGNPYPTRIGYCYLSCRAYVMLTTIGGDMLLKCCIYHDNGL